MTSSHPPSPAPLLDDTIQVIEDSLPPPASAAAAPWRVLVVDDDAHVIGITRLTLEGATYLDRPIELCEARSGRAAVALLAADPGIAVVLLDVVMESDDSGLLAVQAIRERLGNHDTRIVLRTGQPGVMPARDVVLRYEIDGYESKAELTATKLFTTVIAALRSYERAAARSRALDVANRALATKDEFLAAMSHEMRTPLHGVLGAAALLDGTSLDALQRDHLSMIQASGKLLRALIDDVLDLARMEHGELRLEPAPASVHACVEASLRLVREAALNKGLSLLCELSPDLPRSAVFDASRLEQVLVNLLSNAVKFTPSGHVTLRADALPSPQGATLRLRVTDSGIGIAESVRGLIFQPFMQADRSTSRRYGGAGLGLSICKRIVDAMRGEIRFESAVGGGTTFEVCIPVAVVRGPRTSAPQPPQPSQPAIATRVEARKAFQGLVALVADDNVVNLMIVRHMLGALGLEVDEAYDGGEAIERARARHYDVVFMDVQMPNTDGLAATAQIRSDEAARHAPRSYIVALTANARAVDRERCLAAGMDEFLSKPFNSQQLCGMVALAAAHA